MIETNIKGLRGGKTELLVKLFRKALEENKKAVFCVVTSRHKAELVWLHRLPAERIVVALKEKP